eukprot:GILI01017202.1.p1 GENE.GILI01017202.1~~GILI01017202.1.p1  ORF type:complete len:413 (-),score=90.12 GILI01017202.1:19-1257(-)
MSSSSSSASAPPLDESMKTSLIHLAYHAHPTTGVSPPIFQTSTFRMACPEDGARFAKEIAPPEFYTRCGNPNNKQVEEMIAHLEGGEKCLVVGSGMAAVSCALMSNLKAGDHLIAQYTHYTGSLSLFRMLENFGVEVTQVNQTNTEEFSAALKPNTRIVYIETPTNPTMELTDIEAVARIAHEHGNSIGRKVLVIADNTFASSFNQRPLALGCDMVIHSATKYLNGHADVTAGAIIGPVKLIEEAWDYLRMLGPVLHPFEAWLLRRGLQTYALRMEQHNKNGMKVASFLDSHPFVERVYYPGLPSHPQHDLAVRQMSGGFGGMIAFNVKGGFKAAYTFVRSTKVCVLAVSLGGMESLITHPASMVLVHQTDEEVEKTGISPSLIRMSIGTEAADDIIGDLSQALEKAKAACE